MYKYKPILLSIKYHWKHCAVSAVLWCALCTTLQKQCKQEISVVGFLPLLVNISPFIRILHQVNPELHLLNTEPLTFPHCSAEGKSSFKVCWQTDLSKSVHFTLPPLPWPLHHYCVRYEHRDWRMKEMDSQKYKVLSGHEAALVTWASQEASAASFKGKLWVPKNWWLWEPPNNSPI